MRFCGVLAACASVLLILPMASTAEPTFVLTPERLIARTPDGKAQVVRTCKNDRDKLFVSQTGSFACLASIPDRPAGQPIRIAAAEILKPIDTVQFTTKGFGEYYLGDIFFSESGASALLNGFGTAEQYSAEGVIFFDPHGKELTYVRREGVVAAVAQSEDGAALAVWSAQDRKSPNHINHLALYQFDGSLTWETSTGESCNGDETVIGREAVYSTTYAPGSRIVCRRRSDGKQIYDRAIENGDPKQFAFYRYVSISEDECTIVAIGYGSIVSIKAKTGRTLWSARLKDVPTGGIGQPRWLPPLRPYSITCSKDGSLTAVLVKKGGSTYALSSPKDEPFPHWLLLYDAEGSLQYVKQVMMTTAGQLATCRLPMRRYIVTVWDGEQLAIIDGINEEIVTIGAAPDFRITRAQLLPHRE